jgi:hypothetical protein
MKLTRCLRKTLPTLTRESQQATAIFSLMVTMLLVQLAMIPASLAEQAASDSVPEGSLAQLLEWIQGDFDNYLQYASQTPGGGEFSHLGLQRRLVAIPALGEHVIYAQINRRADPSDVYRQFVQVFSEDESGQIQSRILRFVEDEQYLDILAQPDAFAKLTEDDFRPALAPGCEPHWRVEGNAYVSRIDKQRCVIASRRDGKPRHIQSTEFVEAMRIRNEESGYLPDGTQLFGLPDNVYYEYQRVDGIR